MKRLFTILISALLLPSMLFTACGRQPAEDKAQSGGTELVGGWTVNIDDVTTPLSDEEKDIFTSATAPLSSAIYEPIALLGTQVVAGMNYAFLCRATNVETTWNIAVIYKDLSGRTKLTSVKEIDLGDIKAVSDDELDSRSDLVGAYSVSEDLSPVLLGTQLVSGTNYKSLYISDGRVRVSTVYEDLKGNRETMDDVNLDLNYYVTPENAE